MIRRRTYLRRGRKPGRRRERKKEEENLRFIDGGGGDCSWDGRNPRRILSWER